MRFEQLFSGSSANLYTVSTMTGKSLLIECGVPYKKLLKALKYDLSNIEAVLCSHEHKDHSKAILELMEAGQDIYSSAGTFSALGIKEDCPQYRRAKIIKDKDLVRFPSFQVFAFKTNHDAQEPLGFAIREPATNEYMLFATDTSFLEQRFAYPFKIIALECSYNKEILQHRVDTNDINETLAKRLLTSHLEKTETMRYIEQFCDLSKCTEINLLHCSADNLDKEKTCQEFEQKFKISVVIK